MSFHNYKLNIKAKTWKRESYGLFDYETPNFQNQNITTTNPGKITRRDHQVSFQSFASYENKRTRKDTLEDTLEETLLYVVETPEGIRISNEFSHEENSIQLWSVVDNTQALKGQALRPDDVIKLGRIHLKISQIKVEGNVSPKRQILRKSFMDSIKEHMMTYEPFVVNSVIEENVENDEKNGKNSNAGILCKICLYDKSDEEDDPLISPCKCTGSVKYVHLKCMQNWVKSKLNMKQNRNIVTIMWKNLNCELCKEKLPITINQDGEDLTLVPFENKLMGSYVILESFSKDMDSTGIHLIDLTSNQKFRIGRGNDCDLKISDISVSRVHSTFVVSNGNLYLKDNNSKFGTLVLRKDPIFLTPENRRSPLLQIGRTLFRFSLNKPWISYLPCLSFCFSSLSSNSQSIARSSTIPNEANDETQVRLADDDEEMNRSGAPSN